VFKRTAVVDTDSLINLTHLKILKLLQSLFSQIHIPMEVRKEYELMKHKEPDREWLLERLKPNEGFYSLCTKYDTISFVVLKGLKGIHTGEAEVAAQHLEIGTNYIISDDLSFKESLNRRFPHAKIISTLHIISMLDLHRLIHNRDVLLRTLHLKSPVNIQLLRASYWESAKEYGIHITKKEVNDKNNPVKIGIK